MPMTVLREQAIHACRRLLSEENRDPYSPTYGCFDRRFWGWKIVDFPEATYQRNACALAWLLQHPDPRLEISVDTLTAAVQAALRYTTSIQHKDGSFDQAFPHEHSFGATAFLLHSLLAAFLAIRETCSMEFRGAVEGSFRRAADFLCHHGEQHGHISNHLAGAALSLREAANYFDDPRYYKRSDDLLEQVTAMQSVEGWFPEYEGSDPGYQTLCLYYLARLYILRPDGQLKTTLGRSVEFLSWFAHPDGTFGGEYGSRRTAIFYPGGLALLAREIPLADNLFRYMADSIVSGHTVTLQDVDIANVAPVLENYLTALDAAPVTPNEGVSLLPCQTDHARRDFPQAGIYIRGTHRYYAVLGVSNGCVLKVFDRAKKQAIWNDGGYAGQTVSGRWITTQVTDLGRRCTATPVQIALQTPFYALPRTSPTPMRFILLRLINLTVMRSIRLGNLVKKLLVGLLMTGKQPVALALSRTVEFGADMVTVRDRVSGRLPLRWLECGRAFVAIHMASARYFERAAGAEATRARQIDVETLSRYGEFEHRMEI